MDDRYHTPTPRTPLPAVIVPAALDGGLGYDDLYHNPAGGVIAQVGPWDGFENGDTVQLFLSGDDRPLAQANAGEDDKYRLVTMTMDAYAIIGKGSGTYSLFARVTGALGVPVESVPIDLRVKLEKPGGLDTDPETPFRNENLDPPAVTPSIVEPGDGAKVTIAPYENMAAGDVITVRWGRERNELVVGPLDDDAIGKDIVVDVSPEVVADGGIGADINVNYQIYDAVSTWSQWSPAGAVEVIDPDAPDAPWVEEAELVDDRAVLDLDALGEADATARLFGLKSGDLVVLHLVGTRATGEEVRYASAPTPVAKPVIDLPLPNAVLRQMVQSSAQVWYERTRGQQTLRSNSLTLHLSGRAVTLPAPRVVEAVGATIDPAWVASGAHVEVVDNDLIVNGAKVTYTMTGTNAAGAIVFDEDDRVVSEGTPRPLTFVTPAEKMRALAGRAATFGYAVEIYDDVAGRHLRQAGQPSRLLRTRLTSPTRTYTVLGDVSPTLRAPELPQARGTTIDPDDVDGALGVEVTIPEPSLAAGDRILLTWRGSVSGVFNDEVTLREPSARFFVGKAAHLVPNLTGTVTLSYTRIRNGAVERSAEAVYTVGTGVGRLPSPDVPEASGGALSPAAAKDGITVSVPATVDFMQGDLVTAQFGSYTSTAQPGGPSLAFAIPAAEIAPYLGQSVVVTYTVFRAGTPHASDPLTLTIGEFADADPSLPRPRFTQANGTELDLGAFVGEPVATVAPWPLIAAGQAAWIDVRIDGGDVVRLRDGTRVTSTEAMSGLSDSTAIRARLESLPDGTALTLACRVAFRPQGGESDAVTFPEQVYRLRLPVVDPLTLSGTSPMTVGETQTYVAAGGTPPYAFSSTQSFVASIDSATGFCEAFSAGTTFIKVTDARGVGAQASLVVDAVAAPLDLDGPSVLQKGASGQFQASGGTGAYVYASSVTSVAIIHRTSGLCSTLAAGTTEISVTDGAGKQATKTLTVQAATQPLTLSGPDTLKVAESGQFTASGGMGDYAYASSTTSVATIAPSTGACSALRAGTTVISVTDGAGNKATKTLTVQAAAPPLTLSGPTTLKVTESGQFTASGGSGDYAYASGTTSVATIDRSTGACRALRAGTTVISATDGAGKQATKTLTVTSTPPAWDTTFDFDSSPITDISSKTSGAQLRFDGTFHWFFDRHHLPSQEQFIGVKSVSNAVADMYSGRVLRIGNDRSSTLVEKRVLCELFKSWSRIRFAVSSIDDPITLDFYADLGSNFSDSWSALKHVSLQASPSAQEVLVDAPPGKQIKWIRVICKDTIHLDFFKMKS
ncbi:hypothetical protein P3W33_11405 [Luteibacter sp. PPL552]